MTLNRACRILAFLRGCIGARYETIEEARDFIRSLDDLERLERAFLEDALRNTSSMERFYAEYASRTLALEKGSSD